jgi:hypothetical protein
VACFRLILRCLTVAMLAAGLASAPLYAVAQASDAPATTVQADHGHMDRAGQVSADHDYVSPGRFHAMDQGCCCCQPGCIMAVVPGFASLTIALMSWTTLAIPRDQEAVPFLPQGLDRPPKLA